MHHPALSLRFNLRLQAGTAADQPLRAQEAHGE
jgi:hypothetical protein